MMAERPRPAGPVSQQRRSRSTTVTAASAGAPSSIDLAEDPQIPTPTHHRAPSSRSHQNLRAMNGSSAVASASSASSPTSPITTHSNTSTGNPSSSRSRAGSSAAARYLSVNTQAAAAAAVGPGGGGGAGAVPPLPTGGDRDSREQTAVAGAGEADAAALTPTLASPAQYLPTMSAVQDAALASVSPSSSASPNSATQANGSQQRPALSHKSSSRTVGSTVGAGSSSRKSSAPSASRQASGSGKDSSRTRDRERRKERGERSERTGDSDDLEDAAARMPRMHLHDAPPAPPTLMYWSRAPVWGSLPTHKMRSHSASVVDNTIVWLFGGCDDREFWRDVLCLDVETMEWTRPETIGDVPPPCRAHTATLVDRRLFVFGGGQANMYYNALYILDTVSRRWSHVPFASQSPSAASASSPADGSSSTTDPEDDTLPRPRRAHTAVLHKNRLVVFGGGNGAMALNDVWLLDVGIPLERMRWVRQRTTGAKPTPRGYHTANLVGNVMIVVGGSDGRQTFSDIYCLNLDTWHWSMIPTERAYRRLAHTATQIGSYLFIMGGHDGSSYTNELLLFNLVSLQYEPRPTRGPPPSARGYHAAALADGRLWIFGGYDGRYAHDDVHMLDLASSAYLSQVTGFKVSVE